MCLRSEVRHMLRLFNVENNASSLYVGFTWLMATMRTDDDMVWSRPSIPTVRIVEDMRANKASEVACCQKLGEAGGHSACTIHCFTGQSHHYQQQPYEVTGIYVI